jgi:Methyltransferase domain
MQEFWDFFNQKASSLLQREVSFRKMFEYLDQIQGDVIIVETGCVRNRDPWAMTGEGHSTLLFDHYINCRKDDSKVFTVDINPQAIEVCRSLVSSKVTVHEGDSVAYLNALTKQLRGIGRHINLLYLDSYDVDYNYWYPSAAHHLKELTAAWRAIDPSTLVVVDDCPMSANLLAGADGQFQLDRFYKPIVGGKGRLVAEFAEEVEAKMVFSHYQHAWNGFQG